MGLRNFIYKKTGIKLKKIKSQDHNLTGNKIGKHTYYFDSVRIFPTTIVGNYCSIADGTLIAVAEHPTNWLSSHPFQYYEPNFNRGTKDRIVFDKNVKTTKIGNDVWIGANAIVQRGVIIGDGAIIGSGAIVTKDVPPYAIVGGVPARIIKYRFDEETINKLIKLEWWNLEPEDMRGIVDFNDINKAIEQITNIKKNLST